MQKIAASIPEGDSAVGMSVKEARKRLGKSYRTKSDEQIKYIVTLLSKIAEATVRDLGSKITY
jgi:hypothetical protein